MRSFDTLTEQEILALAVALEEEDARIYDDFADGLREKHPEQAEKFKELLQAQGLTVVDQFETWDDAGKTFPVGRYEDVATVFRL